MILHLTTARELYHSSARVQNRLFARFVTQSSRLLNCVQIVASIWENISVKFASSLMMIPRKGSFIVMIVGSAELVVERTFFTAGSVYLFDSLKDTTVMKCGHTMHCECYHEMIKRDKYCCPICSKSVIDMSRTWKRIDEEIEATVMPEDYWYKKVLTFDCCSCLITCCCRFGSYVMTAMTLQRFTST
ncbi:hypothetical protein CRYUN_Cryun40dG0018900 [Craigia yunnanensis]